MCLLNYILRLHLMYPARYTHLDRPALSGQLSEEELLKVTGFNLDSRITSAVWTQMMRMVHRDRQAEMN